MFEVLRNLNITNQRSGIPELEDLVKNQFTDKRRHKTELNQIVTP